MPFYPATGAHLFMIPVSGPTFVYNNASRHHHPRSTIFLCFLFWLRVPYSHRPRDNYSTDPLSQYLCEEDIRFNALFNQPLHKCL